MAIRTRGSKEVDTCTFDMPPELGQLLDADIDDRNKKNWPQKTSRGSTVLEILSDHYKYTPEVNGDQIQKN